MINEDSNGETGFEIVDKRTDELSTSGEKTESLSSMSSSASLIPSPSVPVSSVPSGNLLSSVPPPSELPSFIATTSPTVSQTLISPVPPASTSGPQTSLKIAPGDDERKEPFYPTTFSPAIPPSKGIPQGASPLASAAPPQTAAQADPTGGIGLFGWVKEAVSGGGILSKVAEKAKNSVDSMITTLDPQMREIIYSGGDLDILVASDKEIKISPVREAFQSVFGKATVTGISVQSSSVAVQPVGFAAGVKAAEERLTAVYAKPHVRPLPVVTVENFLLEVGEDKWYDMGVLILSDPTRQINLQTFTQMTPVPTAIVNLAQEDTPEDYPLRWSGFSVTIGSLMANNLQVDHSQWHHALTGVSRREMILLAAKTLAGLYKNALNQN